MRYVIRDPVTDLYVLSWHDTGGALSRIEWVEKARASSYKGRSEAKDVLAAAPPGVVFEPR